MRDLNSLLDTVVMEGQHISTVKDATEYNFMCAANRMMRKAELTFGAQCLGPVIDRIADKATDGPAVRVLLSSLIRLTPTRQSAYVKILTAIFPSWRNALDGNPQDPLPEEFHIASVKACQQNIEFPPGLLDAVEKATQSSFPDVVITALKFLEQAGIHDSVGIVRKLIDSANESVRVASILTAARLSILDASLNAEILNLTTNSGRSIAERRSASEALLIGSSSAEGITEFVRDSLLTRSDAKLFYDTLLDSANTDVLSLIEAHIEKAAVESLQQCTLRRIIRIRNISPQLRGLSLETLQRSASASLPEGLQDDSRFGLIAHRNSDATGVFVGHACICVSDSEVIDCSTSRGSNAVQMITFDDWKADLECWGIREDDDHQVDLQKAVDRAHEINSWRTEYDGTHDNQKGEWIKGWFCAPKYWEADCVGFTEHCYEYAGGDPTPNDFGNGSGWPLTVREQRDHMRKVFNC